MITRLKGHFDNQTCFQQNVFNDIILFFIWCELMPFFNNKNIMKCYLLSIKGFTFERIQFALKCVDENPSYDFLIHLSETEKNKEIRRR